MGFTKEEMDKKEESKPEYVRLSRAISLEERAITARGEVEQRRILRDLETIYRMDGLIFGIVNKYVRDVTGIGYSIVAEDEISRATIERLVRDREKGFNRMLRFAIRDSLIYGFALFELAYDRGGNDLKKILRIDPKTVEFQREAGKIKRDIYGYPAGFSYEDPNSGKRIDLPKENIAFFTFFPLIEGDIGISPLEVLYKPILFKLNVEEATGEALWRIGFPPIVVNVGDERHYPSEKEIEDLSQDLTKLKSKSAFVFPYWTKIQALETGKPAPVEDYLVYFNNLIRECMGIPRIEAREVGGVDYERTVLAFQNELAEQVEEQIFAKLAALKGLKEVPRMKFIEHAPEVRLSKARRMGVYSRSGLITRDLGLEKAIRLEEGLPIEELTPEREIERKEIARRQRRIRLSKPEEELLSEEE